MEQLKRASAGWGQEEDRRRSKQAGFDHHMTKMTKPIDFSVLEELRAAMKMSRSERQQNIEGDVHRASILNSEAGQWHCKAARVGRDILVCSWRDWKIRRSGRLDACTTMLSLLRLWCGSRLHRECRIEKPV
jgi:hypothetical protein